MRRRRPSPLALLASLVATLLLPGCATEAAAATGASTIDVDGRPFELYVPPGYDPEVGAPLVLGLHAYMSDPAEIDAYFGLRAAADERGFLLALPEGLTDADGNRYWAAVEGGCCDLKFVGTDDSTYLSHVLTAVTDRYRVTRTVVVGHSNGGFMAHRLACDHADQVDAIASLAGPLGDEPDLCRPSRAVTVLHVHGDADGTVGYLGRWDTSSAQVTAETWAELDGCTLAARAGARQDVDPDLPGAETTVQVWDQGCRDGSQVQLWSVAGGPHVPPLTDGFRAAMLDYVLGS